MDKISIDSLVFLDDDTFVFKEGVQKYHRKYKDGKSIPPIRIFYQNEDNYFAREGRHRTYMFYHRLRRRTIPVSFVKNPVLTDYDRRIIKNGEGVTIHDLELHSMDELPLE